MYTLSCTAYISLWIKKNVCALTGTRWPLNMLVNLKMHVARYNTAHMTFKTKCASCRVIFIYVYGAKSLAGGHDLIFISRSLQQAISQGLEKALCQVALSTSSATALFGRAQVWKDQTHTQWKCASTHPDFNAGKHSTHSYIHLSYYCVYFWKCLLTLFENPSFENAERNESEERTHNEAEWSSRAETERCCTRKQLMKKQLESENSRVCLAANWTLA